MATYQRYQAQALAELHEGGSNPGLLHELRTATDYALRTTKSAACALGKTMSTLVVQERHLWLNLADMRDVDKVRFLDSPISQAGLFGDTVDEFTQEFKAVREQSVGDVLSAVRSPLRPPCHPYLLLAEGARLRELHRPRTRLWRSERVEHLGSRQLPLPRTPLSPATDREASLGQAIWRRGNLLFPRWRAGPHFQRHFLLP